MYVCVYIYIYIHIIMYLHMPGRRLGLNSRSRRRRLRIGIAMTRAKQIQNSNTKQTAKQQVSTKCLLGKQRQEDQHDKSSGEDFEVQNPNLSSKIAKSATQKSKTEKNEPRKPETFENRSGPLIFVVIFCFLIITRQHGVGQVH